MFGDVLPKPLIVMRIVLTTAAFLVALIVAEVFSRWLLPMPGLQPFPTNQPDQLLIEHPSRSYAYRPGFVGTVHATSQPIEVRINHLGMRDDPVAEDEPIDVLAVGDSFTAGYMLEAADAWPERLEHYLVDPAPDDSESRPRVLNGAVSGYSIEQIRLAAEEYGELEPDIIVAGVLPLAADRPVNPYVWYQGYAVRAQKVPYLKKTTEGFLAALPDSVFPVKVQFAIMENFRFGGWVWLTAAGLMPDWLLGQRSAREPSPDDLLQDLLDEVGQMNKQALARGQRFVVMLITPQQPDGSFRESVKQQNSIVADYCMVNDIPVFDPLAMFEENSREPVYRVTPDDYHWSPLANDIAARGLARFLADLPAEQATAAD